MTDQAAYPNIQDEVLDFLLLSPTPQNIIDFHASDAAQRRLRYLLDANRDGLLSDAERAELNETSQINHFITRLKAKAHQKLMGASTQTDGDAAGAPSLYGVLSGLGPAPSSEDLNDARREMWGEFPRPDIS